MKLAACYNVFNGTELLKGSIDQISAFVDEIILLVNLKSNYGEPISAESLSLVHKIQSSSNARLIWHTPSKDPIQNARDRFDARINLARELECTHFFISAEDHYYNSFEFERAKQFMIDSPEIDVSLTGMYTYYKKPTWQITPCEEYYMPFIMKLGQYTKSDATPYVYKTDPGVRVSPAEKIHLFSKDQIMMHHYSMVRKNILSKFRNAQSRSNWQEKIRNHIREFENYDVVLNPGISYFKGRKVQIVPNYFNIGWD